MAANPATTTRLDIEQELRALEAELSSVKYREQTSLIARHAVRPDDLVRYVRESQPTVIHFSGHGANAGIVLRSDLHDYQQVSGASLRRFLDRRGVELVVLNACYSDDHAQALAPVTRAVVGTSDVVGDEAARRFTVAFYRSLGNGLPLGEAFRDGTDAVILHERNDVFHAIGEFDWVMVST